MEIEEKVRWVWGEVSGEAWGFLFSCTCTSLVTVCTKEGIGRQTKSATLQLD